MCMYVPVVHMECVYVYMSYVCVTVFRYIFVCGVYMLLCAYVVCLCVCMCMHKYMCIYIYMHYFMFICECLHVHNHVCAVWSYVCARMCESVCTSI